MNWPRVITKKQRLLIILLIATGLFPMTLFYIASIPISLFLFLLSFGIIPSYFAKTEIIKMVAALLITITPIMEGFGLLSCWVVLIKYIRHGFSQIPGNFWCVGLFVTELIHMLWFVLFIIEIHEKDTLFKMVIYTGWPYLGPAFSALILAVLIQKAQQNSNKERL